MITGAPHITDHFTWAEATTTSTGLPNQPSPDEAQRLAYTFSELERVRALLGRPLIVHSAFRSEAVNASVGGVPSSQHRLGEAVDFHVEGLSVPETVRRIAASPLPFDQLLDEAAGDRSWVHVSFTSRRAPRRQALTMRETDGKQHYAPLALS